MQKLIMLPYKMGSESARDLARALGIKRVFPNGRYKYYNNHTIINWGSSTFPSWDRFNNVRYLNHPASVCNATNKKDALTLFERSEVPCPKFFTSKEAVIHYTVGIEEFPLVYCRKTLTGHSGSGIVLANSVSELVNAPLYTLGFPTRREYRVHVFRDRVIDYAKKSCRDGERPNKLIRNFANGWIFRRGGVELPEQVGQVAIKAVKALGLDFGAVDIVVDKEYNPCVLEVNTACGIKGESTLASYTNAFKEYLCGLS